MIQIEKNFPLKNRTSFRIGGPAEFYVRVNNEDEIKDMLGWARDNNHNVFILGKGSNILVSDTGWQGLVIDITGFSRITWNESTAVCQSGAMLHSLVKQSVERGFCGIEELAGIPGSIGGALVMNAGAFSQTVSDCLHSVSGIDQADTSIWKVMRDKIDFGYRSSSLKKRGSTILSAEFRFSNGNKEELKKVFSATLQKRSQKQPLDIPNCGSVFKRPPGNYAGALIEQCNLKGFRVGGATVSEKHANFIVNDKNATATDVRELIASIQKTVFETKGVLLEPEVLFVGEFDTTLYLPI